MCDLEPFSEIWSHICIYIYISYDKQIYDKQKQPGTVKKRVAKHCRIKSIVWHLR